MEKNDIKQIPRLISEGKSLVDIAAIYNVHISTVKYWVKRFRNSGKELTIKKGRPYKIIL